MLKCGKRGRWQTKIAIDIDKSTGSRSFESLRFYLQVPIILGMSLANI